MRSLPILAAVAFLSGAAIPLHAQDESDSVIHAVTALHPDGTKTVTITDPDKHTTEATTYDGGDKIMRKVVCSLDENNLPVTGVVYNAKDVPAYKTTYKYDASNRLSEEDDYTMSDQLMYRFVYDYTGTTGSHIRAYDAQGNELRQSDAVPDKRQSLPRVH